MGMKLNAILDGIRILNEHLYPEHDLELINNSTFVDTQGAQTVSQINSLTKTINSTAAYQHYLKPSEPDLQ